MPEQEEAILSPDQIYHLGSKLLPSSSSRHENLSIISSAQSINTSRPSSSSLLENLRNLSIISSAQSINTAQSVSSTVVGGSGGGCGLRIFGQSDLDDNFRYGKKKNELESVLSKIQKINDLAGVDMGAVGSDCCSCLGLMDPVTNIHINRLVAAGWLELPPAVRGADEGTMDGGVRGADEDTMDGGVRGADEDTMAHRSLNGLIAFLTCLFPYLPDAEALTYIDAASADPLVAALLVMNMRGLTIDSFITAASVEIALKSAAVAAKHPDPKLVSRSWKLASLHTETLVNRFKSVNTKRYVPTVEPLLFLFRRHLYSPDDLQFQHEKFWGLALDRVAHVTRIDPLKVGRLPSARGALKRMLLSVIHGYYLKALAALPKQDLTERYHQSLLMGGHCYGPLDPVSNIIVNTIWYEQSFPAVPATKVQLKAMISTESLWRIASCSLYGLVSFLCTRNKRLTPDQALHDLMVARANLSAADPAHLSDHGGKTAGKARKHRGATVRVAYIAAAQSAKHPSPDSQADFLGVEKSVHNLLTISDRLLPTVWDGFALNKDVLDCIIMLLRTPSSVGMPYAQQGGHEPIQLREEAYFQVCEAKNSFWLRDKRIGRMVEAALRNFNQSRGTEYRLHIICGVNELVEREFCVSCKDKPYNPWTPHKYHYSHINFLATPHKEGSPELFFAECSNHGTDTAWCVPVPLHPDAGISLEANSVGMRPEAARCIYCEHEMSRIIHPITKKYCGRDDFEKFDNYYSNNKLLSRNGHMVDDVEEVADDAIYSNFCDSGRQEPIRSNGMVSWL